MVGLLNKKYFDWRDVEFHPIANMFPLMPKTELKELAADIKKNGLRHNILLYRESQYYPPKILDGRNRYLACKMAKVEPDFEGFTGTYKRAMDLVWTENVHRRNLTSSQRAAIMIEYTEIVEKIEKESKERQAETQMVGKDSNGNYINKSSVPQIVGEAIDDESPGDSNKNDKHQGESDDALAKASDTNRQYISDAKKIKKESPDVLDLVKDGAVTIPQAKKIIQLDPETQDKVVGDIKTEPEKPVREIIKDVEPAKPDPVYTETDIYDSIKKCVLKSFNVSKISDNNGLLIAIDKSEFQIMVSCKTASINE